VFEAIKRGSKYENRKYSDLVKKEKRGGRGRVGVSKGERESNQGVIQRKMRMSLAKKC
jgi:hypothetical protein